MPITLDYMENGEVVRVTFTDPWTAAELMPIFEADQGYRDRVQRQYPDKNIHLIADFREAANAPDGALIIRKIPSLTHPTSGSIVIVGANHLLKHLVIAAFRVAHYDQAVFVKTMDEAMDTIHHLQVAARS